MPRIRIYPAGLSEGLRMQARKHCFNAQGGRVVTVWVKPSGYQKLQRYMNRHQMTAPAAINRILQELKP